MSKASELLGKRISLFLVEKGWKQSHLIRATGIGNTQMSNYVNGKISPNLETIEKISIALEKPISDFFKEEVTFSSKPNIPSELVEIWSQLDEAGKKSVLSVARGRIKKSAFKKFKD